MSAPCWCVQGTEGDGSCPRLIEVGFCFHCPVYAEAGRRLFDREMETSEQEHWTRLLAEEKAERVSGMSSVMVFRLGEECLALPARVFDRVLELRPHRTVPGRSNPVFAGLVNVGGELLPCVNARVVLRIPETGVVETQGVVEPCLVVVRASSGRYAFAVDEMLGLVRYDPSEVSSPPATLAGDHRSFASAILETGDRSVTLLDPEALFQSFDRSIAA